MLNKKTLTIVILIVIVAIGIVIPATYARFSHRLEGTGKVEIAKWDIEVNGKSIDEEITLDFFENIENVTTSSNNLLMPGSEGKYTIKIKNKSDVTVVYDIKIKEILNAYNIPIKYSLDKNGVYKDDLEFVVAEQEELLYGELNNTKEYTIYWKWPFDSETENVVIQTSNEKLKALIDIEVKQKIN